MSAFKRSADSGSEPRFMSSYPRCFYGHIDLREKYNVVPPSVPGYLYGDQIVPAQSVSSMDQVTNVMVVESLDSSFGLRGFYSMEFEKHRRVVAFA
ncbi:unnamed protein product [Echinostoma caproni]|uniref:UDENN domain-containing protein n=1 Tax=Echinostoma caproni TaxID=27848 RepID=A0A183B4F6_9TREM|nr:unnamed protein product [Echinostoma caproni]